MISFFFAFLICVVITPVVGVLFSNLKLVDIPDANNLGKTHTEVTPFSGGCSIGLSCSIVVFCNLLFFGFELLDIFLLSIFMILIGLLDDVFSLDYKFKLCSQSLVACLILYVYNIEIPYVHSVLHFPLSFLWIVGITNAINLIDNLDGATSGSLIISLLALLCFSNIITMSYLCILLGALCGFVYWNWYPAKMFLGDAGTLFLGFSVATLSLLNIENFVSQPYDLLLFPMFFAFPILDTTIATVRRVIKRRPIYLADGSNITFLLKKKNWKDSNIILFQYFINFACCMFVIVFKNYI